MAKAIVKITDPAEMAGFIKSNGTQCRFVGILTRTPVVDIRAKNPWGAGRKTRTGPVSYTHLRAHETPEHLVCRLLLEKKKKTTT